MTRYLNKEVYPVGQPGNGETEQKEDGQRQEVEDPVPACQLRRNRAKVLAHLLGQRLLTNCSAATELKVHSPIDRIFGIIGARSHQITSKTSTFCFDSIL